MYNYRSRDGRDGRDAGKRHPFFYLFLIATRRHNGNKP
jgi:hypothetical protein